MPEGPELHLASLYVNRMCHGVVFTGAVIKSEVSKSPAVAFTCPAYRISATSRGKEVKLTLTPMKSDGGSRRSVKGGEAVQPMDVVFRFGMSGYFRFTPEDELPKHAHLRFYTKEKPRRVLSFVDARRFGSWQPGGSWQPERGPCIMFEYKSFRENVVSHLSDRAFDRPICEVLLNQKYFNGVGNYLRAEILYRLNVPPFAPARAVLEGLEPDDVFGTQTDDKVKTVKAEKKVKAEAADLLRLCHTVPLEVVGLGGKGYDPEKKDYSGFEAWLQCYYVDGMKSIRDHNGRTMWFKGDPGPMAPKEAKSPKAKKRVKKADDHDYTHKTKVARRRSTSTVAKKEIKQEAVSKTPKREKDVRSRGVKAPDVNSSRKGRRAGEAEAEPLRRSTRARRNKAQ
ncbi:endonuclease 8-like 1 [Synchiropus splendidus]|uniref:endonuclease 8-like 1 n=1 Tax=Synchiropus splendidus TaxID=270530 RepID=UPI00237EAE35|nr:endonuclease 8-like 1 [Synchiropus splendidus]